MGRLTVAATALLVALSLGLAGCKGSADQLLETARFEELQNNPQHARELYEQIVRDHPDSEQAKAARERLAQLTQH